MSNGNVERCATLLITRSESEYHGDVLLFSRIFPLFNENIRAKGTAGFSVMDLSGGEFRERRGNICGGRNDPPLGCAADTYICRPHLIALPRFLFAFVRYFVGVVVAARGVRCIDLDRALCRVYGRGHATGTRRMKSSDRSNRYSSNRIETCFRFALQSFSFSFFFSKYQIHVYAKIEYE